MKPAEPRRLTRTEQAAAAAEARRADAEAGADAGAPARARRGLALGGVARGHGGREVSDGVRRGAGGHRAGLRREPAEEKETAPLVWRTPWTLSTNITVGNSCRTTTLYTYY